MLICNQLCDDELTSVLLFSATEADAKATEGNAESEVTADTAGIVTRPMFATVFYLQ